MMKLTKYQRKIVAQCLELQIQMRSRTNDKGETTFKGIPDVGPVLYITIAGRKMLKKSAIIPQRTSHDGMTFYNFADWAIQDAGWEVIKDI